MNDTVLAILVSTTGLWIPFIIWDHAGRDKKDKWYAIPQIIIIVWGVILSLIGFFK